MNNIINPGGNARYINQQHKLENNFISNNSISAVQMAARNPAFTNPQFATSVGCGASYPGPAAVNGGGVPDRSNFNYVDFMNAKAKTALQQQFQQQQQQSKRPQQQVIAQQQHLRQFQIPYNQPLPGLAPRPGGARMEGFGNVNIVPNGQGGYNGVMNAPGNNVTVWAGPNTMGGTGPVGLPGRQAGPPEIGGISGYGGYNGGNAGMSGGIPMGGYGPSSVADLSVSVAGVGLGQGSLLNTGNGYLAVNDPSNTGNTGPAANANGGGGQSILDLKSRPQSSFTHNNMVPFFRKATQSMAGTGVKSGNYTDGTDVNSGFDQTTPYQTKLATFTGIDDTFMHKREVPTQFSPAEQQTGWVYKTPLMRPEESRYTVSLGKRNDMRPVEPQMVGPGIDLDPSIPAQGGFHPYTRVLPNNVGDYKANQLEGRVQLGKFVEGAQLPTAYPGIGATGSLGANPNAVTGGSGPGVPKNKANTYWDQQRRPTMTNKVGFATNIDYTIADYDVDKKPGNDIRDNTSYGYGTVASIATANGGGGNPAALGSLAGPGGKAECSTGVPVASTVGVNPAGGNVFVGSQRSETYMSMDNNVKSTSDCNSQPIGNPNRAGAMLTPIDNWSVNETGRGQVGATVGLNINLKGSSAIGQWRYVDAPNTTMKETNNFAYSGNPQTESKGETNSWKFIDAPNTTMKETNNFSYAGNVNLPISETASWKFVDVPNTTMKETNEFAYSGNPEKEGSIVTSWMHDDLPKATISQSTNFSYAGNTNLPISDTDHWKYADLPKSTISESTNFSYEGIAAATATKVADMSRQQYTGFNEQPIEVNSMLGKAMGLKEDFTSNISDEGESMNARVQAGLSVPFNSIAVRQGGASTYSIRGDTLIVNWVPGAGRSNILQDPNDILGRVDFGHKMDNNTTGSGTIAQATPNMSAHGINRLITPPTNSPNKQFAVDDRQLASYQVEQLRNNPLSIYTIRPDSEIPSFECNVNPLSNASNVNAPRPVSDQPQTRISNEYFEQVANQRQRDETMFDKGDSKPLPHTIAADTLREKGTPVFPHLSDLSPKESIQDGNSGMRTGMAIYPPNGNPNIPGADNANMLVVYNSLTSGKDGLPIDYNALVSQGSSRMPNENLVFTGKCYSGEDQAAFAPITASPVISKRQENDVGVMLPGDTVCTPNYVDYRD